MGLVLFFFSAIIQATEKLTRSTSAIMCGACGWILLFLYSGVLQYIASNFSSTVASIHTGIKQYIVSTADKHWTGSALKLDALVRAGGGGGVIRLLEGLSTFIDHATVRCPWNIRGVTNDTRPQCVYVHEVVDTYDRPAAK